MFRVNRDKILAATDKFMLPDFPIDTKLRSKYKDYRQYLRQCPALFSDETIKSAKIKSFVEWCEWQRGGVY